MVAPIFALETVCKWSQLIAQSWGMPSDFERNTSDWYIADRSCYGSDCYLAKIFQHGISGQDENGPLFVRR